MRGPLPDELLSVIEKKNALEQLSGNAPVVYGDAFALSGRGALPLYTLGLGGK